jgi:hypothetical protein
MASILKALKKSTKAELLEVIRASLDCGSHFHKPTIVNNDKDFAFGDKAIVICDQCVERMREALALDEDESVPTHFQFNNLYKNRTR